MQKKSTMFRTALEKSSNKRQYICYSVTSKILQGIDNAGVREWPM